MEKTACKHKLFLNKTESVFGLKRVSAVVDCHHCRERVITGKIMSMDQFETTGEKVKTYWLRKEAYPDGN